MKLPPKIDRLLPNILGVKARRTPAPSSVPLEPPRLYDGRTPLLTFGEFHDWTLNDAYMGTQIFGGTGSGKTSGSGAAIARSFLRQGFGGLILSAKPDELELWQSYCAECGRELAVFGPGQPYRFNFLNYEYSRAGSGGGLPTNIAELFAMVAERKSEKGGANEAYFENAMKQMLRRAIHLLIVAKGEVSLTMLMDLIMSAAQSDEEAASEQWRKSSFLAECLGEAEGKRTDANGPDLDHTRRFWLREFARLGDRTRSSIVSMFTVLADALVTNPMRELFCTDLNILPEETHVGRLIFVNLPVEEYKEVGVCAQLLMKLCWQEATARRKPNLDGGIPTFLWADEAQFFCSSSDQRFQATARSKRACTVYLTQNLPTYFDRAGKDRTNALLGNLQTKILHSNGDHVTNTFAADTIARGITKRSSSSFSATGGASFGTSEAVDYVIPPAEFQRLRTGGPENNNLVDAYIFQAGRIWPSTGESFVRVSFKQPKRIQ